MLKKTVALGAVLTTMCADATFASPCFYKSGFFAGAQIGASVGRGKYNNTFSINPALPVNTSSASATANKTAAIFGILGGYRHVFNQDMTIGFTLEADVFANNQLNKQLAFFTNPPPALNVSNSLKKNFDVIPSVVLGKIFCGRWHASLGLGLAIARFKQQFNVLNPAALVQGGSFTKTKVGFVPTVGVEYAATPNVSVFGKVGYEFYSKINKTFTLNVPGANPSSYTSSIKPGYFTVKLGATYRF